MFNNDMPSEVHILQEEDVSDYISLVWRSRFGREGRRERAPLRLAGGQGCECMVKDDSERKQESQEFYSYTGG